MRKEEKTRLRREKIITAALFEFATKGYQGFVINEPVSYTHLRAHET